MKKKICYITTISITIKAFFVQQLKFLAENGYEVVVICSPDETLQEELGDKIRYIPIYIERGMSMSTLASSIIKLKEVFSKEKFDIVQYSTPNAAFYASIASKMAGVKVRNYHLMGLRYIGEKGIKRRILKIIEKLTCRNSTHIECVTASNLELAVSEKLFSPQKATVIWNGSTGGINLEKFDYKKRKEYREEVRKKLGFSSDDFIFGFVGRITKDKGIDELLEAFSYVKDESKLLIVGPKEGICTLNSELWSNAENDEKIIIHGSVSDIEKYYATMDVLLLPSYREGFGMVIAEAAAMGTPAIVSNIPGPIDAILENQTAFTVNVKDAEDLKNKMEMFIEDHALCEKMGASCVNFVSETFDSRILCEKILERKESLLG